MTFYYLHQNTFAAGDSTRTYWGSLQHSPDLLAGEKIEPPPLEKFGHGPAISCIILETVQYKAKITTGIDYQ